MAEVNGVVTPNSTLIPLQSKDHEEILDVIDQLRLEGVSKYVDLPQLIVCGDQSSGKSSVLEAISGLGFPTKDNLCTRFATELILRRSPESGVTASIHPDEDRSEAEKQKLRDFKSTTVDLAQFKQIVCDAERLIGAGTDQLPFSKDVLRVEVSGPTQPHLTMVDLPGLYHAPDETQSEAGVEFVESLVLSYIQSHRSVILAVVSAKSDIALQKVTAFTRRVDPSGARTLGVITKPDTLIPTSDMEKSFVELAKNRRVAFRLGWHVVKNRDHNERHLSLDQRRDVELTFFGTGVWASLQPSQIGIDALRPRLSSVLKDHIVHQLPSLIAETQQSYTEAKLSLSRMGDARKTTAEQRRYLLNASDKFTVLLDHAINGTYTDPSFGDAMDDEGYHRRLRAVIQNELLDFSETLWERGEKRHIIDDDEELREGSVRRSDFVQEVLQRMRRSRGRELLGTFNPLIVGDLFYLQAQPWEGFVTKCIESVMEAVQRTIHLLIGDILDERTSDGVLTRIINPEVERLEVALKSKTEELLKPPQSGHPITYNHYFTDIVQKTREEHLRHHFDQKLKTFFGVNYPDHLSQVSTLRFSMDKLIEVLSSQTEANMERFACSEAIDYMQAYYKVARKKFVDDFSNLAVEKCLLEPIKSIFCAQTVERQTDEIIHALAAEDEMSRKERTRLEAKSNALLRSLNQLQRLDRHHFKAREKVVQADSSAVDPDGGDIATETGDNEVMLEPEAADAIQEEDVPPPEDDQGVFEAPDASTKKRRKKPVFYDTWTRDLDGRFAQ